MNLDCFECERLSEVEAVIQNSGDKTTCWDDLQVKQVFYSSSKFLISNYHKILFNVRIILWLLREVCFHYLAIKIKYPSIIDVSFLFTVLAAAGIF